MGAGARLREAIARDGVIAAMSCHSPLSARLAAEAGFPALWAGGFELSALLGLPDTGLVTMSQHLEMTRLTCAAVATPVIADLDTGFGDAMNLMHAVRAYEDAGVAAVVVEDKTFPKMTSLAGGAPTDLVRTEAFVGKVEAALAARRDPGLVVVARTEALIVGAGEAEALARAHAYDAAGADLILVHSKASKAAEIESFSRAWTGRARLVVVPTAYPDFGLDEARALGNIAVVIHGNHGLRAAVAAMQTTLAQIAKDGRSRAADAAIAPVEEIFRLQGMAKFKADQTRFVR